jgi:hypothetical protein
MAGTSTTLAADKKALLAALPADGKTARRQDGKTAEPDRVEPDPERLDTFIAVQLSDKTRTKIVKAVK